MMPRVLAEPGSLQDGVTIQLDDGESHHLRVRRIGVGDMVMVLDGEGRSAHGAVIDSRPGWSVAIGEVQYAPPPPTTILAVGAGDQDRFLLLAEHCTELGVTELIPTATERSRTVDTRVRSSGLDRARRRAREACKQSGSLWAAVVAEPCELAAVSGRHPELRWLIGEPGGATCPPLDAIAKVGWIIGPEGGLTPGEAEYCRIHLAAEAVSFGPAVLRFDTAAVAAGVITQDRRRAH